MYADWPTAVYSNESELRCIHRHFYHPTTERLFLLTQQSEMKKATQQVFELFGNVQNTFDACQRNVSTLHRLQVAVPYSNCLFNSKFGQYLMKICKRTILHIFDCETKFSASVWLTKEDSQHVRSAFLTHLICVYTGYPDMVIAEQGPQCQSADFISLLKSPQVLYRNTGVELYNVLEEAERYHIYLGHMDKKVSTEGVHTPGLAKSSHRNWLLKRVVTQLDHLVWSSSLSFVSCPVIFSLLRAFHTTSTNGCTKDGSSSHG